MCNVRIHELSIGCLWLNSRNLTYVWTKCRIFEKYLFIETILPHRWHASNDNIFSLINLFHSKRTIPLLIHLQFPTFAIDVNQCPSFFCQSNASSFGIVFLLVKSLLYFISWWLFSVMAVKISSSKLLKYCWSLHVQIVHCYKRNIK